jgi:hypothetical protein
MGTAGRKDTRETHGERAEPVHPNTRREGFLIGDISHTLGGYRNLVSPLSEDVREVENVAFLAANVRWKELGEQ